MPPPARPPEATLYHNLRVSSRDAKILACRESPVSSGESTPGKSAEGRHGDPRWEQPSAADIKGDIHWRRGRKSPRQEGWPRTNQGGMEGYHFYVPQVEDSPSESAGGAWAVTVKKGFNLLQALAFGLGHQPPDEKHGSYAGYGVDPERDGTARGGGEDWKGPGNEIARRPQANGGNGHCSAPDARGKDLRHDHPDYRFLCGGEDGGVG